MKIQKIIFICLIFIFVILSISFGALIEERATYKVGDNWVYEGVVMDAEGKFPQKKYTLIKDLNESILYGNRDIYEELRQRLPIINKDTFQSMFSEQDMASIIAGASGSETVTKKYGDNEYYETIKEQEIEENGVNVKIYSIIDMIFEDSYIHSFSLTYRDKMIGLNDYNNMLASFKVGKPAQQEVHNSEYYLRLEREEKARKEAEEKVNQEQQEQPVIAEAVTTEQPNITEVPQVTTTPEPTVTPLVNETAKKISGDEIIKAEENEDKDAVIDEKSGDEVTSEENNENELEKIIENSGENVEKNSGNIIIDEIDIKISNVKPKENGSIKPTIQPSKPKKTNMFFAIIKLPIVRNLIIFCIIFDITITIIIKYRKKKKKEQKEKEEQNQEQTK